jgi:hypothetical protein
MKTFFLGITLLLFSVNILNAEVNNVKNDVINLGTPCEDYAHQAATAESDAYGGQCGYSAEEYFDAWVGYLDFCSYGVDLNGDFEGVPAQPVFIQ